MPERKRLFLLGAGASAEAGVPTTRDMTERMHELVGTGIIDRDLEIFRFVVGGLLFRRGVRGESPYVGVDIEELLNALGSLAERHSLEASEFVGSWHPRAAQLDRSRSLGPALDELEAKIVESVSRALEESLKPGSKSANPFSRPIDQAIRGQVSRGDGSLFKPVIPGFESVDSLVAKQVNDVLERWVASVRLRSKTGRRGIGAALWHALQASAAMGEGESFRDLQRRLTSYLSRLAWLTDSGSVEYLAPLLAELRLSGRLVVATLNYDNAIELLARSHKATLARLGDDWTWGTGLKASDTDVTLLKLHGSVDWTLDETDGPGELRTKTVRVVAWEEVERATHVPAVVFGGRSKLQAQGPYLELLSVFRDELTRAQELVVVGYSFRDDHVNEYIGHWLAGNPSRSLVVIDSNATKLSSPFGKQLLSVGAPQVIPLETTAGEGLAEYFAGRST